MVCREQLRQQEHGLVWAILFNKILQKSVPLPEAEKGCLESEGRAGRRVGPVDGHCAGKCSRGLHSPPGVTVTWSGLPERVDAASCAQSQWRARLPGCALAGPRGQPGLGSLPGRPQGPAAPTPGRGPPVPLCFMSGWGGAAGDPGQLLPVASGSAKGRALPLKWSDPDAHHWVHDGFAQGIPRNMPAK